MMRMKTGVRLSSKKPNIDAVVIAIKNRQRQHKGVLIVAMDGRSGCGKSTIAHKVGDKLDAVVVKADDFYAGGTPKQWENMSAAEKMDFVIDWKRLRKQAIEPLRAGKNAEWPTFNWLTQQGLSKTIIKAQPNDIVIVEGIYSARPELDDVIDYSILVHVKDETERLKRLNDREGEDKINAWQEVWEESEDYYFEKICSSTDYFDLVIENS